MGDPAMPAVLTETPPQFTWFETVTVAVHDRAANSLSNTHIIMS